MHNVHYILWHSNNVECLICLQHTFLQLSNFLHFGSFNVHSIDASLRVKSFFDHFKNMSNCRCRMYMCARIIEQIDITHMCKILYVQKSIWVIECSDNQASTVITYTAAMMCIFQKHLDYSHVNILAVGVDITGLDISQLSTCNISSIIIKSIFTYCTPATV